MSLTWFQAFLIAMLPPMIIAAGLTAIEYRRDRSLGNAGRNLLSWLTNRMLAVTMLPLIPLWANGKWALIDTATMPFWLGLPVFLLARDFWEFFFHWLQHRIPLLWAMHAVHHSDPDMGALTNQRHYWGDQVVKRLTVWPAALITVGPTPQIIAAWGVLGLWNFFYHTRLPMNFGRWSWVLNSPDYHRRHHSRDPADYGCNLATLFPIFDVIFGTYRPGPHPAETGLDHPVRTIGGSLLWPVAAISHPVRHG